MNIKAGTAYNAGTNIYYEVLGNPVHETLILISGLGSQLVYWTDELCQVFVDRNFQVVRFDNRDVGLSSKTPGPTQSISDILQSEEVNAPYTLSDMAADTIGILDALEVETAHMMGVSLGGMIAPKPWLSNFHNAYAPWFPSCLPRGHGWPSLMTSYQLRR